MRPEPAARRSIEQVLGLLSDPVFCDDARRAIADAARLREHALALEHAWNGLVQLGDAFHTRWGVPPPQTAELLQPDPRRRRVAAIVSGRWGLVPVFPWTTRQHVRGHVKRIRTLIGKQHQDALVPRRAQLTQWLDTCGFDRPTIARAVFGRRSGLRRMTETQAIARVSEDREIELYEQFRRRGIPELEIQGRIFRTLRGSEPRATATVRMAARRYRQGVEHLNKALVAPIQSDPVSHALTMLFRALPTPDNAVIRPHADALHAALLDAVEVPAAGVITPSSAGREAIMAARWGLVPLFP